MKKILSMALTAMMAVSCAEAQDVAFTVEGTAPQGVDTLYVFYNGQMNEAQPIAAKEGKFEVKGNQPAETFITVAASNQLMVAAVIDGTKTINIDLVNKKVGGSELNEKLNTYYAKMSVIEKKMNDLAPEWQKLRGDKTEEGKTKMKALEQKIDAVEAEQNAENDKKERERIDKLNQADSMIFTTENFLKDNGDKIPADQKPAIEEALSKLKDAHKSGDVSAIDTAINNLNTIMQAASQQMYQQAGPQQAGPQPGAGQQGGQNTDDNIQDADFEEVK